MNYELAKEEFIKLKKEELAYIDTIANISKNKVLTEYEKLEIYRNLNHYKEKLNEILKKIWQEFPKDENLTKENLKDVLIEFDLDKNYLSSIDIINKEWLLEDLGIDTKTHKFKLTLYNILSWQEYKGIDHDIIQNNQKLLDPSIYIFCEYYDSYEDYCGPGFGQKGSIYGEYEKICNSQNKQIEISEKEIPYFESDNIIIYSQKYVRPFEINIIFKEELLNKKNKTINDCVEKTKARIEKLNFTRSPEYKEKILLEGINKLYKKIQGTFIKNEILYSGNFLDILRETYKLPNETIIKKKKIVKNGGKNSVIIVALTEDKKHIITFQNRIKNEIIAEFPSGYIEDNENPIEAAERELKEETGYITDDLFIVDHAYTSPGIDNSITYIVIANNCIKSDDKITSSTEFITHGLFSESELNYLITKNIMNGAMNKLAYYNLTNNVEECIYKSNTKAYKTLRKKNPLKN